MNLPLNCDFTGKVVVVTGAGGVLCGDMARAYAQAGAKVAALDEYELTEEQKGVLKLFAYRFIKIDFERVANYYAFNATDEEKKAIERLRLVLVDNGINGFIEDDMLRVLERVGLNEEGE